MRSWNRCALLAAALVAGTGSKAVAQYALETLASFNTTNGSTPQAGLLLDAAGNLYGTTETGGANQYGTVFEIASGTNSINDLASFNYTNGAYSFGNLIADSGGNLYGTTDQGGTNGYGTVFQIAAGTNALSDIVSFNIGGDGTQGTSPVAGLIADSSGNLYGTTMGGGVNFDGTVFEVAAGTHALTTLAAFNETNGETPSAGLIFDAKGNLYGTTSEGGAKGDGTVFEIAAGTHALTTLVSFTGANGEKPGAGLVLDANGNLYGTTQQGGQHGDGTVFEIANGTQTLSTLVAFKGTNGSTPDGGLMFDSSGNLFGTTLLGGTHNDGSVFEIAAGTNAFSTLASFDSANGRSPVGDLIADTNGNLYGMTNAGGVSGVGTVFELVRVPEPPGLLLAMYAAVGAMIRSLCRHQRDHRTAI